MSVLSVPGRNPEQKTQLHSVPSVQSTITAESAQSSNTFHFSNGDEYVGQFTVVKDKQKVSMQGKGVYKTSDGQIYEGTWENDYLKDDCKVTFPDGTVFTGTLDEMTIQGSGKYSYKESVEIEGNFLSNSLIGKVYLKDPNDHTWKGKTEENDGGDFINFYPLHTFWQSVLNFPKSSVRLFYGEAAEENESIWEGFY